MSAPNMPGTRGSEPNGERAAMAVTPAVTPADLGFGELFWRMRDAVTVTDASTGRVVLWNPAAERIFGYTAAEAAQLEATSLIPERVRGEVLAELTRFAATGRNSFTEAEGAIEYPVIRKGGEEITIEASAMPLEPPAGSRVTGVFLLSISRDVTERKRAEALRERWARHAALRADVSSALNSGTALPEMLRRCTDAVVEHLGAAFSRIWTLNVAERVLVLQASSGLYTHLNGAHGRVPVGAFKIGKIAEERAPHLTNDVQHDERVGDKEWAAREGMVAFAGYPLLVEGRLLGVLALFAREALPADTLDALAAVADIVAHGIDRARAERELQDRSVALERSNADLEQFAYVASHDLQEPLRTVVSYLQLLEADYRETLGETGQEFLAYAVEGSQRMQTLIEDLLSYSRIGRRGRAMGTVAMEEVLRDVLADLRGAMEEAGTTVTSDPLPVVEGDASQLGQLVRNLIGNALKFRGSDGPTVHVSATPEAGPAESEGERDGMGGDGGGRWWRFSVRDNGIGIEEHYHEQIFVIFQRLHVRDEYPGTGIGLAVCKKIVERHGGRLWVESKPGVGSTFHFTLPEAA